MDISTNLETVNIRLKSFHEGAHVISIANRMMYLNGKGQESPSVPLKFHSALKILHLD